jgi:hypothetical protein
MNTHQRISNTNHKEYISNKRETYGYLPIPKEMLHWRLPASSWNDSSVSAQSRATVIRSSLHKSISLKVRPLALLSLCCFLFNE